LWQVDGRKDFGATGWWEGMLHSVAQLKFAIKDDGSANRGGLGHPR